MQLFYLQSSQKLWILRVLSTPTIFANCLVSRSNSHLPGLEAVKRHNTLSCCEYSWVVLGWSTTVRIIDLFHNTICDNFYLCRFSFKKNPIHSLQLTKTHDSIHVNILRMSYSVPTFVPNASQKRFKHSQVVKTISWSLNNVFEIQLQKVSLPLSDKNFQKLLRNS